MANHHGVTLPMRIYYPVAVLLALSFALAGCMPLPWKSEEPRIEKQELQPFTIGVSTREDFKAALGAPDLVRRDNQLWIYGWSQGHGKFFGPVPWQPLYFRYHVLFVEFDAAGVLHDFDLVDGKNACSKSDVCVKHWKLFHSISSGLLTSEHTTAWLLESVTIITASDTENQRARHFIPDKYSCGFYLFANEEIDNPFETEDKKIFFQSTATETSLWMKIPTSSCN